MPRKDYPIGTPEYIKHADRIKPNNWETCAMFAAAILLIVIAGVVLFGMWIPTITGAIK